MGHHGHGLARVAVAYSVELSDDTGLDLSHRFAGREACAAGINLDHRPQLLISQLLQATACPVAISCLAQALAHLDGQAVGLGQGPGRLEGPFQRAAIDSRQGYLCQFLDQGCSLSAALVVQMDIGCPAGEPFAHPIIHGVTDQEENHRGHRRCSLGPGVDDRCPSFQPGTCLPAEPRIANAMKADVSVASDV